MLRMKRIGILTSGGDCGGLNGVIKGAAQMGHKLGITSFVIPNGYAGLYNLGDFDSLAELTTDRLDRIDCSLAGSEAGHSRVKIKKIEDPQKYEKIKKGMQKFKLDGLVISGGDDSGSVMVDLAGQGIKCIHAPKTMDLDLQTYSVGFDSTVNRIAAFLEDLKTTARTHNRVMAMEVFGRYAGHTAFRAGIAAEADAILIPEIPTDFDILYAHCKERYFHRIATSDVKAGTYLIIVAEGLKDISGEELVDESAGVDAFGHKRLAGAGKYVCDQLTKHFKSDPRVIQLMQREKLYVKGLNEIPEIRAVTPGHLVRCGHSSVYDVNFGKEVGAAAVVLLKNDLSGVTVTGISGGKIQYMETAAAIQQRHVDLQVVALHEQLGTCFGRKPGNVTFSPTKKESVAERYL